jgi:hypothetical protein
VNNEMEKYRRRWPWTNLRYYIGICPEILRKSKKTAMCVSSQKTLILMPEEDAIPTFRLAFHLNQEAEGSFNKLFKINVFQASGLEPENFVKCCKKTKVNQPLYSPGQALKFPRVSGSQI